MNVFKLLLEYIVYKQIRDYLSNQSIRDLKYLGGFWQNVSK